MKRSYLRSTVSAGKNDKVGRVIRAPLKAKVVHDLTRIWKQRGAQQSELVTLEDRINT